MNPFPFVYMRADAPIQVAINGVQGCAYNAVQAMFVQYRGARKQSVVIQGLHQHHA